ncbi:ATP-grasp fold, RimK-type domain protein [Candidatus Magnetomorum sp. HK-1]|nr:ATP-grasp fold, RimK-type domain protein [Candidatus Magnetomorum sp. HK-1]
MKTLGICTKFQNFSIMNFEKQALYTEAKEQFDEVLLIDTRSVSYQFIRGHQNPIIIYMKRNISDLSILHVRSTKNREASTAILVHSLSLCGCKIFDPLERFSIGYASKLLTELGRFKKGIGIDSFIAFNIENTLELLQNLESLNAYPLIAKPIAGRLGFGIERLSNYKKAKQFAETFFSRIENVDIPIFIQRFKDFRREFRVLVINGESLAVVQKEHPTKGITVNAAQGAVFKSVNRPDIAKFTIENTSKEGILGVDVAEDSGGELYIIEANRAPLWRNFELATGINVAQYLIKQSLTRLSIL